jgi:hypothetical protein
MPERYYYGRPPSGPEPTPRESPWRLFQVKCQRCGGARIRAVACYDEGEGSVTVTLQCPCGSCEKISAT